MILKSRDINILLFILRYRYVFTPQLYKEFFAGLSNTAMHKALKKLVGLKYVEKHLIYRTPKFNLGSVCYLTAKGATALANELQKSLEEIGFRKISSPIQSINHAHHRYKMIDFLIRLDKDLGGLPVKITSLFTDMERDEKYIPKTAIKTYDGKYSLVPDISFILKSEKTGNEAVFFVEIDTATETISGRGPNSMSKNSLAEKYYSYQKILEDGGWKNSLKKTRAKAYRILTVTETGHVKGIFNKCRKQQLKWPELYYMTTHQSIEKNGMLITDNWNTLASYSPCYLIH